MSSMLEDYVRKIYREDQERERVFANTNFDSMTDDYWYHLSRTSVNAQQAAFLIANISPKAKEDFLNQKKRSLLADARMLIDTCQIESMSAPEWLRWANEHSDSPPDLMKEKERVERVLLAFDRNPGKQQKAELEGLQQALERERAKNQELSRRLENTECALDAAQRGEAEAVSGLENAEHVHDVMLRELRETIESELLPPLKSELDKARSEIEQLTHELEAARDRPAYRLLTAALIRLLSEAKRTNPSGIKRMLLQQFSAWKGLGSRNLDDMFKEAGDAEKNAGDAT